MPVLPPVAARGHRRWAGPWGSALPLLALLALAAVTALTACAGRSTSVTDYGHKVARTALTLDSTVQIAVLDAQGVRDHKTLQAELDVSLEQVASDSSSTVTGFSAVLPPDEVAVMLQQRSEPVFSSTVSLLREARVRAGRGDDAGLAALLPRLKDADTRLTALRMSVSG